MLQPHEEHVSNVFNSYKCIYSLTYQSYFWECIFLTHLHTQNDFYPRLFTIALFLKGKDWKELKYLQAEEWLSKLWYMHTWNIRKLQKKKKMRKYEMH